MDMEEIGMVEVLEAENGLAAFFIRYVGSEL